MSGPGEHVWHTTVRPPIFTAVWHWGARILRNFDLLTRARARRRPNMSRATAPCARAPGGQGGDIQSFLATPTRIYTTVYVYVYVYRYTAYTIYRQHGAKFCQVLSSLPCIRARPYHCISWADSTPTRIYTTLLHYKIYTTLRIFLPWRRCLPLAAPPRAARGSEAQ